MSENQKIGLSYYCGPICIPFPKFIRWNLNPQEPQTVTVFVNTAFKKEVTVRPLGWVLIQPDWCPYNESRWEDTGRHWAYMDTVQRPCGNTVTVSHLQATGRGLRKNQTCQHLDLRFPASRPVKKLISVV